MEGRQRQEILIVDNDERVLQVMDSFLTNAGFDTKTASDGQAALTLLQLQVYDLVLVADHLADFSLGDFLAELQRFGPRLSVIVMESALSRPWESGQCRVVGARKVVSKWRPCEVLAAASEAISNRERI